LSTLQSRVVAEYPLSGLNSVEKNWPFLRISSPSK
jgi:hypothetical protein